MKKLLFSLLLAALVLMTASCSSSSPEIFEVNFVENDESINLGGFTFVYSVNIDDELVLGYFPESLFAEVARLRIDEVEKMFNCNIKILNSGTSGGSYLTASIVAGSFFCDAIMMSSWDGQAIMRADGFIGISTLENIDYKDTYKWGTPNMLESMFWKDDLYGVLPASWPELLYSSVGYAVLVNENLIKTMGVTDPRDYVENKTWTWDKFEEVLEIYTQEVSGVQVYGMAVHTPYYGQMFMLSNGTSLIEKDANGNYTCGFYTENAKAAFQRGREIFTLTRKDCFYPAEDNATTSAAFLNGEAVLFPTWASRVVGNSAFSYEMDNLGLVHFPQGPKADPDVYVSVYEASGRSISIPINAFDPDASALIINAIYEPLKGYETEAEIIDYLTKNSFFDERDVKVFLNMFYNTRYAFYYDGARYIPEAIGGTSDITQILESNENRYNELFENVLVPVQMAIDKLWPEGW